MKNLKYFIFLLTIGLSAVSPSLHAAELTCTNGDVTALGTGDYCFIEPSYYGVTVYEMGLCTSAPTAPTTTSVLDTSNCVTVFQSTTGALIEVQDGVTSSLPGPATRPPNGTYTHAYMRLNNTFLIEGTADFGAGHATITNRYCVSNTHTTDNESTPQGTCSATSGATPGRTTTELTDFDGASSTGLNSYTQGNLTAYILDSNNFLAESGTETSQAGAEALTGVMTFATPVTLTDSTTSMNANMRVSQGMTVVVQGANNVGFDSGPFVLELTVN